MTMSAIIADVGTIVTGAIGWGGEIVTFITSNPLILLFVLISLVGTGAGLVMRLIRG